MDLSPRRTYASASRHYQLAFVVLARCLRTAARGPSSSSAPRTSPSNSSSAKSSPSRSKTRPTFRWSARFYLAGTYICQQAILGGRIDIYPEYTGTALTAILKQPPSGDPAQVYDQVKAEYAQAFHLAVGQPFGFNNTFAIEIRGEDARRLGLKTISQAAAYTPQWRAGFGYEFMERPDGYKGLAATYGLRFAESPRIMDLGLLARALKDKQIDLAAGNTTDGLIPALDLFVLEDDRHYFPPYEAVPIMRQAMLARHPEVEPPWSNSRERFPMTTCAGSTMQSTASTAT